MGHWGVVGHSIDCFDCDTSAVLAVGGPLDLDALVVAFAVAFLGFVRADIASVDLACVADDMGRHLDFPSFLAALLAEGDSRIVADPT